MDDLTTKFVISDEFWKNISYPSDTWDIQSPSVIAFKATVLGVIFIFSLLGNSTILWLVARTPPLYSPVNLFIANVALSDLVISTFCTTTFFIFDIHQNYILGPVLCRVDGSIKIACLLNTVLSLSAISCDRLLGIVYPFKARLNNTGAIICIFINWIVAIGLAMPPYFFRTYKVREWLDRKETFCAEEKPRMRAYWTILLIFLSWIPFTVMTVAYSLLICRLDKYDDIIRTHNPKQMQYRKKIIKMLFAIIIVFHLCWIPFQVLVLYRNYNEINMENMGWYKILYFIAHYFVFLQTTTNPIIYGVCNPHFRRIFFTYFPALRRRNQVNHRPQTLRQTFNTELPPFVETPPGKNQRRCTEVAVTRF